MKKVILPRLCTNCGKEFICIGNCPTLGRQNISNKIHSNCFCKECYLQVFGKNRNWRRFRHKCYDLQSWRIA